MSEVCSRSRGESHVERGWFYLTLKSTLSPRAPWKLLMMQVQSPEGEKGGQGPGGPVCVTCFPGCEDVALGCPCAESWRLGAEPAQPRLALGQAQNPVDGSPLRASKTVH